MGCSGESARIESESESVVSFLRRLFPVMGKRRRGRGELKGGGGNMETYLVLTKVKPKRTQMRSESNAKRRCSSECAWNQDSNW